jgi:superfamily II DNA or RNA helicase
MTPLFEEEQGAFPTPRAFQIAAHEALRQGVREGHRRQLILAPTGAGKTYIASRVINEAMKKGRRAMFLCDRRTLILQTSETATRYGMGNHSIIMADHPRLDLQKQFQIASLQTLMRRGWPKVDVLVIDEAHTQYKTWVDFVMSEDCTAMVVGLSATPFSPGLGKIFTNLINAATMHQLTENGVLVPMRVFSCRRPDMTGAETSGGEWTDNAAAAAELLLVGDVVSEWSRLAQGLKTIVFGATIAHCAEITRQFNESGIPAAMFTSDTPEDERKALLEDYRKPDSYIRVLVSVEALAKGFDVPDVGCVCDCRPLRKSLSTAIQMWGRGLRSSPETGKVECLLLDFSGNIIRFADDYSEFFFNGLDKLDDGEKLDKAVREDKEKEPKACPRCHYMPMGKRCVQCGFEPAPLSRVEHLPGQMEEITLNGKKLAPDAPHLWAQVATYARIHSTPEKQQGRAAHLYREMTGEWPPREFKVETAPLIEPTRHVIGKIKSLQIAFRNRRAS